ncbi:hypothetical protein Gpo141_00014096, partial [Globisporangium polare]
IGDLLAMNSGLGRAIDLAWAFGNYTSDKDLVAALGNAEPAHSLRSEYEYANANFAILGQLIESVTGVEWDAYIKQRIWDPLGMTRTFASASAAQDDTDMSAGYLACEGQVLGPYTLVSPEAQLITGDTGGKIAAGSVVSSVDDMAKVMRLILNKGTVDGVKVLSSPEILTEMVSGKSIVKADSVEVFNIEGYQFVPEGNTLAAGYGFDFISHALWGHAYFDKGGDTVMHRTRTGFAPDAQLGVIIMANSEISGRGQMIIDHVRSYVMGIFLDVPKDILDFSFAKWRKDIQLLVEQALQQQQLLLTVVPECGERFWKNPTVLDLNASEVDAIVGVYVAQESSKYFGSATVSKTPDNRLELRAGKFTGTLDYVLNLGDEIGKLILLGRGARASLLVISKNASGKYEVNLGVLFSQQ